MEHIIWQDAIYENEKDWEEAYREFLDMNDLEEGDKPISDFIADTLQDYFDDEMMNLYNIVEDNGIICIADLGLWHGRRSACNGEDWYRLTDAIKAVACGCNGYTKIYVEDGDLTIEIAHHDGTNVNVIRKWKPEVTDEQKEDFRIALRERGEEAVDVDALTEPVGPDIAKVYGW